MKITKKDLKSMIGNGWSVDTVTKPKPKPVPKPSAIDETNRAIANMATVVKDGFSKKVIIEMPELDDRKKKWKFLVERDNKGFIKKVLAEEI